MVSPRNDFAAEKSTVPSSLTMVTAPRPEEIASWRNTEGYPYDGTVQMNGDISIQKNHTVYDTVSLAKFAFSILWEAADFAMQHGVVVLYDF